MSLKQCNMASDSWEASADKAQMPGRWAGGSPASRQRTRPQWSWLLSSRWARALVQTASSAPREKPPTAEVLFRHSLRVRPCAGWHDRSLCAPPPPCAQRDTGLSRCAFWEGYTLPCGLGTQDENEPGTAWGRVKQGPQQGRDVPITTGRRW